MSTWHRICFVLLAAGVWSAGFTQPYPSRPIRFIVPYPPGASTDFVARLVGQRLSDALGQPVVVENRGGGGGIIAADLAARAAPDGYTWLFGTPAALCISPAIQSKVPYDTQRDFAPVNRLVVNPQVLVAVPAFPASTIPELVQLALARPGDLSYASSGIGSPQHLGMELLKVRAGVNIVHVPYKGGGPAMTDLLGGRVQMYMGSIPSLVPLLKAGKLKVLGIASPEKSSLLPEVMPIVDSLPGYDFAGTWYGVLTQAKVPPAIVARLNAEITKVLQAPDVRSQLVAQGADPRPMTVDEFRRFVGGDCAGWVRGVKAAGLRPE